MGLRGNRLLVALAAFVMLLILTVWVVKRNTTETTLSETEEAELLPKLDKDTITELVIKSPRAEDHVRLVRESKVWRMKEPMDAEVDDAAVDSALDALTDLNIQGIAATKKENHNLLEVDDKQAIRVIAKGGKEELADILIGASRGGRTMVRRAGATQVLAVTGSVRFAFNKEVKDWRDRVITEVEADKVVAIQLIGPLAQFSFEKRDDTWRIAEGKTIENFDPTKVSSLARSLSTMRASGFAQPGISAEQAGVMDPRATARFRIKEEKKEREVVLKLGEGAGDEAKNVYLKREGNPIIYTISSYLAEQLQPKADSFTKSERTEEGADGAPGAEGAPEALPGNGQLPPEVMRQLQQQLQQQPPQ